MKTLKQLTLFLVAVSIVLFCGTAIAQNESDDENSDDEFVLEEIVVTGSRIVRRDYESSSPIVTVKADTFVERSNIGLEAALNQLPQFTPAGNQLYNGQASTPFPKSSNAPGAATVNLRGLGTNRTLVLVDGKRVQPVNSMLVVDLNTIPSAAVESVEVITGGAAAVYGADAIAGVVNLKLRKDFEGLTFDTQYGMTQEGDGEEFQFNSLMGSGYASGRGHVMLGFNYSDRRIIRGKDRDYITDGWKDPGTSNGNLTGTSNLTFYNPTSNPPDYNLVFQPATAYGIDQNGHLFDETDPFNADHPYTGPISYESGYKINPNGNLTYINHEHSFVQLPMKRYALFGSSTFDLTDNIEFFVDVRYTESTVEATGNVVQFYSIWNVDMPYNHLYDDPDSPQFGQGPAGFAHHPVPAELADVLNTRADPDGTWNYQAATDYLPPYQTITTSNVFQVSGGLRGNFKFGFDFMDDWTWEAYVSHGKSTINAQQLEGFLSLVNSRQILEADQYGKGWSNPEMLSVAGSCTSGIPVFNPDGSVNDTPYVSQDCADYMTLRMNSITSLTQDVVEGNMQGSIVELPWSGDLQFAAGVAYRKEEFSFVSDSGYNAFQNYANVVGNIALPLNVSGSTDASEVYGELLIPLLKDLPFIKSLSLEPGWRYSDYSIGEQVETYKLMGDWAVTDWLRFRGGVQRANRAPNTAELYTPKGASTIDFGAPDACGNWSGIADWGNVESNPNRYNLQVLCQHLMVREGAPPSLYVPGEDSANSWAYNVFGVWGEPGWFPYDLAVEAGNPNLESESADTQTLGVVIDSPFSAPAVKSMRLAVDYFDIEVSGAIAVPAHNTVYSQCMDAQYNSLIGSAPGTYTGEELAAGSPYCALIHREYLGNGLGDFGADRRFDAAYINQGGIRSRGYDIQFDWGADFSDIGLDFVPGRLGVNTVVSLLEEYSVQPFKGAKWIDYTGTTVNASYDYRMRTTFSYMSAGGAFAGGIRWIHLPTLDRDPALSDDNEGVTSSYNQFDLFARWTIRDNLELRGGIDNLLYEEPRVIGANSNTNALGSSASGDDVLGRRFYVGARISF